MNRNQRDNPMRIATRLLCAGLLAGLAGCASSEINDVGEADITEIAQTDPKQQHINNCWVYATVGWTESLVKTASQKDLDLSESWLSYWQWYEQIADSHFFQVFGPGPRVTEVGYWGLAAHLAMRYGFVPEAKFRTRDPEDTVKLINEALRTTLSHREARNDAARVRATLNRAFGLDDETIRAIDEVFGPNGRQSPRVESASAARARLEHVMPDELAVFLPNPTTHVRERSTMAAAFGEDSALSVNPVFLRSGARAWSQTPFPPYNASLQRAFLKRVQRALNDGYPLPISWYADSASSRSTDQIAFRAPGPSFEKTGGWHLSLLTDYEVTNVPGFGTLPVGAAESRRPALDAALDDDAVVSILRVKNSWGLVGAPSSPNQVKGYSDLYAPYYTAKVSAVSRVLGFVTLPAGY
jgi:hypothetical protein